MVRLDQPYRNYAVDLLTPQNYPKDATEPYDDVSWDLLAHYHLQATATADPAVRSADLVLLTEAPRPKENGSRTAAEFYLLDDTGQEGLLEARYVWRDLTCRLPERGFTAGGTAYHAGSGSFHLKRENYEALRDSSENAGTEFCGGRVAMPDVPHHAAKAPRLGVWVPWADTDSIGWVRYSLDQRKVPYVYLRDEDIRAGKLNGKIDVLLYGHVDLELAEQIQGIPKKWSPMAFKKTAQTPSLGMPAESDDITGGIGYSGLEQIQEFVEQGGLLVTLGSGSMLALEGGIVRGVRRDAGGVPRSSQGGGVESAAARSRQRRARLAAHVRVTFDRPEHPIAYGYPARTYVFRQNFPLYAMPRQWLRMAYCTTCLDGPVDTSSVVMEWGDRGGEPFCERPGLGRTELIWAPSDSGFTGGKRSRGVLQF